MLQLFDIPSLLFTTSAIVSGGIAGHRDISKCILLSKNLSIPVGMIGTLIGFVHVLSSLEAPSMLAPVIGVAFLPTLYGLLFFILSHIALNYFPLQTTITQEKKKFSSFSIPFSNMLAACILLGTFVAGIVIHGSFFSFLDFTSLTFVGLLVYIPTYVEKKSPEKVSVSLQKYQSLYKYSVMTMIFAMLYSSISMCLNVQDPTMIGPTMAVGLLTSLYCSISIVLTRLFHITDPNFLPSEKNNDTKILLFIPLFAISIFVLLCCGILFWSVW